MERLTPCEDATLADLGEPTPYYHRVDPPGGMATFVYGEPSAPGALVSQVQRGADYVEKTSRARHVRRLGRLGATAVLLALLAGCGGDSPELLPDLVQTTPGAVSVVRDDGRDLLIFLSAVENLGPGPLVVVGSRAGRTNPTMDVTQLIRRADGSRRPVDVDGELRFVVSETHRHWHYLGFERYELRTLDGDSVGRDRKTGFCLGDRYDADEDAGVANEPDEPVFEGECGRESPGLLEIRQGISPGYGDDYAPRLEGQYVDVTDVRPGRYRLVHEVNPERTLRERRYDNNSASLVVRLLRNPDGSTGVEVEDR